MSSWLWRKRQHLIKTWSWSVKALREHRMMTDSNSNHSKMWVWDYLEEAQQKLIFIPNSTCLFNVTVWHWIIITIITIIPWTWLLPAVCKLHFEIKLCAVGGGGGGDLTPLCHFVCVLFFSFLTPCAWRAGKQVQKSSAPALTPSYAHQCSFENEFLCVCRCFFFLWRVY